MVGFAAPAQIVQIGALYQLMECGNANNTELSVIFTPANANTILAGYHPGPYWLGQAMIIVAALSVHLLMWLIFVLFGRSCQPDNIRMALDENGGSASCSTRCRLAAIRTRFPHWTMWVMQFVLPGFVYLSCQELYKREEETTPLNRGLAAVGPVFAIVQCLCVFYFSWRASVASDDGQMWCEYLDSDSAKQQIEQILQQQHQQITGTTTSSQIGAGERAAAEDHHHQQQQIEGGNGGSVSVPVPPALSARSSKQQSNNNNIQTPQRLDQFADAAGDHEGLVTSPPPPPLSSPATPNSNTHNDHHQQQHQQHQQNDEAHTSDGDTTLHDPSSGSSSAAALLLLATNTKKPWPSFLPFGYWATHQLSAERLHTLQYGVCYMEYLPSALPWSPVVDHLVRMLLIPALAAIKYECSAVIYPCTIIPALMAVLTVVQRPHRMGFNDLTHTLLWLGLGMMSLCNNFSHVGATVPYLYSFWAMCGIAGVGVIWNVVVGTLELVRMRPRWEFRNQIDEAALELSVDGLDEVLADEISHGRMGHKLKKKRIKAAAAAVNSSATAKTARTNNTTTLMTSSSKQQEVDHNQNLSHGNQQDHSTTTKDREMMSSWIAHVEDPSSVGEQSMNTAESNNNNNNTDHNTSKTSVRHKYAIPERDHHHQQQEQHTMSAVSIERSDNTNDMTMMSPPVPNHHHQTVGGGMPDYVSDWSKPPVAAPTSSPEWNVSTPPGAMPHMIEEPAGSPSATTTLGGGAADEGKSSPAKKKKKKAASSSAVAAATGGEVAGGNPTSPPGAVVDVSLESQQAASPTTTTGDDDSPTKKKKKAAKKKDAEPPEHQQQQQAPSSTAQQQEQQALSTPMTSQQEAESSPAAVVDSSPTDQEGSSPKKKRKKKVKKSDEGNGAGDEE